MNWSNLDIDALVEGGNKSLTWQGRLIWKNPLDLIIYQEIAWEVSPTLVIETGTNQGGSALFWRQITNGRVVTVDIEEGEPFDDPNITQILGSSTNDGVFARVRKQVKPEDVVLVNLDSNHAYKHVLGELGLYAQLVTVGSYLIVEDGIDDLRYNREGPLWATRDWMKHQTEFVIDQSRERLGLTNCPEGFLRRVGP